jgi:hypothetical protein
MAFQTAYNLHRSTRLKAQRKSAQLANDVISERLPMKRRQRASKSKSKKKAKKDSDTVPSASTGDSDAQYQLLSTSNDFKKSGSRGTTQMRQRPDRARHAANADVLFRHTFGHTSIWDMTQRYQDIGGGNDG